MSALQFDPDAVQRAASRLRDAGDRVRTSSPLPLGGPPELASHVTHLAHAERRLADAVGTLLESVGLHAQQVVSSVAAADR